MKCPTCTSTELLMTERLNIEIDYCPQCRGVWLDRGELDKIIERSVNDSRPVAAAPTQSIHQASPQRYDATTAIMVTTIGVVTATATATAEGNPFGKNCLIKKWRAGKRPNQGKKAKI